MVPVEARFHCYPQMLPGLLDAEVRVEDFLAAMRTDFSYETRLRKVVEKPAYDRVLETFSSRFPNDPIPAARQLVDGLLSESARKAGKPSWVEMTPANVAAAPHLVAMFPSTRIVHLVRDGRDVACSRMLKRGDPDRDVARWVAHWERALLAADRAAREVPEHVLTIRLEHLVRDTREATYRRMVDFLELGDEAGMRRSFESDMGADRAHLGRWREDLTGEERRVANRAYSAAVERLVEDGVTAAEGLS